MGKRQNGLPAKIAGLLQDSLPAKIAGLHGHLDPAKIAGVQGRSAQGGIIADKMKRVGLFLAMTYFGSHATLLTA